MSDHGKKHRGADHVGPAQAAHATERSASRLFGEGVTKTNALESSVITGLVRGLSTRDAEAALTEAAGRVGGGVGVDGVAHLRGHQGLDDVELDYLFLDGSHSSTTPTPPRSRCRPRWRDSYPAAVCAG
jgi:hypothetical protein